MSDLNWLSRSALLVGDEGINILQQKHVLVVGLGGVGSFAAEFICRSGVGEMTIVDGDVVDPSNRNRQLPALSTNHGQSKADIMQERLLAINPDLKLHVVRDFLTPQKCRELMEQPFDYVMDCIDSLTPKVILLAKALEKNVPIVSSMGAGGRMDPTQVRVTWLPDTYQCVFAQYVRKRLKRHENYNQIKAVFSTEETSKDALLMTDGSNFKRSAYGTISYLPAAFGGVCASVAIRDMLGHTITMAERPPRIAAKKKKKP
ncbi:tRNA threonylcarbamoyladenosine dehydratase [Pedobacter nyackensis]|uniref:tRNA A37 threonylcarbamoyladenosine dehydratase n=1 Tax=Pedobacter nyackensis TaxID=475255 RepID=A0A1W2BSZ1_9SPHI|nr:tRNA threonylcarbamoyladenosine dehydratase [Pedobacter nyackensis]SMC75999.1 tRNA A37 threonylcarbamoyladenosine dehydratase [Pedobacter nyackensis]